MTSPSIIVIDREEEKTIVEENHGDVTRKTSRARRKNGRGRGKRTAFGPRRQNRRRRPRRKKGQFFNPRTKLHFKAVTASCADAIVHPFSDNAIGALLPDKWTPPCIAAMDRLSFDIDPGIFTGASVLGIMVSFLPRCLATGWVSQRLILDNSGSQTELQYNDFVDLYPVSPTFGLPDSRPMGDMYCAVVSIIGIIDGQPVPELIAWDPFTNAVRQGINLIPFSKSNAIKATCSGGRIVGAGIKIYSQESALVTGGTIYGGWIPPVDIFHVLLEQTGVLEPPEVKDEFMRIPEYRQSTASSRASHLENERRRNAVIRQKHLLSDFGPFGAINIQDAIKYRKTYKGIDGITVRYSILQSAIQQEFRTSFTDATLIPGTGGSANARQTNVGADIGAQDLIGPNDFIPIVVWNYNKPNQEQAETYSVRVELRVHLQAEPDGDCPFMTHTVTPDPGFGRTRLLLENKDAYPVVSKGASFKSFLSGVTKALAAVGGVVNFLDTLA